MSAVLSGDVLSGLEFRPLAEQDLRAVASIESSVYVYPWTLGNFRDSLLCGYQCLGCWAGEELVAYAVIMKALEEAHLLNIAVADAWQRRGVGSRFLQHIIDGLRAQRLEMLYLEVRPSNTSARNIYEHFGFRQLGLRRDYYPAVTGREDALFLGLNLAPKLV
ncbi:MAG: ribosomal protein S18-alanine N-acetyltransferase [Betaproteobacteria bacterium]